MRGLSERMETPVGVGCWMVCSIGMLVFNKLAVHVFPLECILVALQMAFAVVALLVFAWPAIHIGSLRDVARWSMVAPFFSGMLLTSILALKNASMTLVIVFRALSPVISLLAERFYPNPLRVSPAMLGAILTMLMGAALYTRQLPAENMAGIGWVILNNIFAVGDRLLQRLMLAKDQRPVDISKTGVTLLNNLEGLVPVLVVAALKHEFSQVPAAVAALDRTGATWVVASCVVGVGVGFCGVWAQSLISATSFLVLVNASKFFIICFEASPMGTKAICHEQLLGAMLTVFAGIWYGKAREALESKGELLPLAAAAAAPALAPASVPAPESKPQD